MTNHNLQSTHNCTTVRTLETVDFKSIREFLEPVTELYPDFDTWYNFRLRRQYPHQRIVIAAENSNMIIGVAILKKTQDEHKICTLFVHEEHRGKKIGSMLLNEAIQALKGKNIYITVAEERNAALKPLLEKYGFTLEDSKLGYYRPHATEFFYVLDK
ncbi:TPA: GNAT family N-acetyltransferase [Photobacterium damselae]